MQKLPLLCFLLTLTSGSLLAQVANPVPGAIPSEGLTVEIEEFVTIPASKGSTPRARINMLRPIADNSGRLFVNDLEGQMYVIDNGTVSLYLNLEAKRSNFVSSPGLGTGFGSITFHPEFATNGKFYTGHSEAANSATADLAGPAGLTPVQQGVVTEWIIADPTSNDASGASSRELLRIDYSDTVHALQEVAFNPFATPSDADYGLLYLTTGDSGSVNDNTPSNTGRIESPMGSILRIDPAGNSSANGQYGIPSDNPWASDPGPDTVKELYAIGFRNPHRISWDSLTGMMLCGNIGERQLEEVELIIPGGNYGWPHREGTFLFDISDRNNVYPLPANDNPDFLYPVAQYDHDEGFAIVGGVIYRGTAIPELYGKYIFGDIKDGRIYYIYADDIALGSQATIYELTLTRNGVPTTLQALAGNSRADLRFGYDNDGEIYILSKADGKVRRLVPSESGPVDPVVTDPNEWSSVTDFDSGDTSAIMVTQSNSSDPSHLSIIDDPSGFPGNKVLALTAGVFPNSVHASIPIPQIPNNETGTVYIRFSVPTFDKDAVFGVSDVANASTYPHYEAALRSAIDNGLDVREGSGYDEVIPSISLDTWYETWLVVNNTTDTYSFYIKGGVYEATTLIVTGVNFRNGTNDPITSYLWAMTSGTVGTPKGTGYIYFDDLHVDNDAINLSSPLQDRWYLLDDFEGAIDDWTFVDTDNQTNPFIPDAQVVELIDTGDNTYLRRAAAPDGVAGNRKAIAYKSLPFNVPVSGLVTLYLRFNTEAFPNNHNFGLSNLDGAGIEAQGYEAFEPIIQVTDRYANNGILRVRNGDVYENIINPNTGLSATPLEENTWYEIWVVVNNGGRASSGQTYDVYLRGGTEFPAQTKVFDHAFFRINRETPLLNFMAIANSGPSGADFYGTGSLLFDDIYLHNGEVLTTPLVEGVYAFAPVMIDASPAGLELIFDTLNDSTYQMEISYDLENWSNYGPVITGDGNPVSVDFSEDTINTRRFFRLKKFE